MLTFLLFVLIFQLIVISFFSLWYKDDIYKIKDDYIKNGILSDNPDDKERNLSILNERLTRDKFTENVLYGIGAICFVCICIIVNITNR